MYPPNVRTWKTRLVYDFQKHLYTFEQGKGAVIGRFTGYSTEAGVFLMTMKIVFGVEFPFFVIGIMFMCALITCYVLGYFWLKFNFDRMTQQVVNDRNPLLKNISDIIVGDKGEKL